MIYADGKKDHVLTYRLEEHRSNLNNRALYLAQFRKLEKHK